MAQITVDSKSGERDREVNIREETAEKYRTRSLARDVYLLRRQRKAVLEKCRRIAVVGASTDSDSPSYVATEKLLGLGLQVSPVVPGRKSYLGLSCHESVRAIPGDIDIVQVYPSKSADLLDVAEQAVEKKVTTFWVEGGMAGPEVEEVLGNGRVQLVEQESLTEEYIKHFPFSSSEVSSVEKGKIPTRVTDRMTKTPVTVKPSDGLQVAIEKMEKGRFRHLPVVNEQGKLVAILSDRDIRLIRPSLAFVSLEDATLQLSSTCVRQAAVFDPITIAPESSLEQAAQMMLRWRVGGLPVVNAKGDLVGIITYTDLLRELAARERPRA